MKTRTMLDRSFVLGADRPTPPDAAGLSAIVFALTQLSLGAPLLLLLLLLLGDAPSQTDLPQDRKNRPKQVSSRLRPSVYGSYPDTRLAVS